MVDTVTAPQKKRRITTQSAKSKGRKCQQWVRDQLLARFAHLTDEDVRSISLGAAGEDILLSPLAREAIPFTIECKARAGIAVYPWYEQAAKHADKGEPLVFLKADRKKPLALVDAEWLLDVLAERYTEKR